jgi:hypothetical protein
MNWWNYENKPHIVADSTFGSFDLMREVTQWGGSRTFNIFPSIETDLWKLMGMFLQKDWWKAAQNSSGMIISSSKLEPMRCSSASNQIVQKNLLVSGFKSSTILTPPVVPSEIVSREDSGAFLQLSPWFLQTCKMTSTSNRRYQTWTYPLNYWCKSHGKSSCIVLLHSTLTMCNGREFTNPKREFGKNLVLAYSNWSELQGLIPSPTSGIQRTLYHH